MVPVLIESPFAGSTAQTRRNLRYLRLCLIDSIYRGEAPFASHGFYTQFLDDTNQNEQSLGMEAGFAWGKKAELVIVYTDLGVSPGMEEGIRRAVRNNQTIIMRRLWPDGKILIDEQ